MNEQKMRKIFSRLLSFFLIASGILLLHYLLFDNQGRFAINVLLLPMGSSFIMMFFRKRSIVTEFLMLSLIVPTLIISIFLILNQLEIRLLVPDGIVLVQDRDRKEEKNNGILKIYSSHIERRYDLNLKLLEEKEWISDYKN